jgi:acyl-coenzyme A thioesterase PaaI-like protein
LIDLKNEINLYIRGNTMNWLRKLLSVNARETFRLRLWALARIPILYFVRVSIVEISSDRVVVRIPLLRRNRNHLGSMYFGALCVGSDCAAGALAMYLIRQQSKNVSLVFKDFSAEFLKRAEGDVDFCCSQGHEISKLVSEAAASEERVELMVNVVATVPVQGDDVVAKFRLTLSLKQRS